MKFLLLCLILILVWITDYCENIGIISMLKSDLSIAQSTVDLMTVFSMIKSKTTSLYFVALIIVLILVGIKKES